MGWQNGGCSDGDFKAQSIGTYDYKWLVEKATVLNVGTKIKINFYEKGFTTPTRSKIVTIK